MAAESVHSISSTGRRGSRTMGLFVRPQAVSDKSYMESVVDFLNSVPQAYGGGKQEDKEAVEWVKFEYSDINDPSTDENHHNGNTPSLLLIIGYVNGVQVWCIAANGEAQEVLSLRQGPVRTLRILATPITEFTSQDLFASKRPIMALCDSISAGQQYCAVNFVSLKTGDQVHCLKFKRPISDIQCNRRVVAVLFPDKISVFDARTFKETFMVKSCFPCPEIEIPPVALGPRWLAFADRKLVPFHQTCGGMAGDGVNSYAAIMIRAAKTFTKGLTMFGETVANSWTGNKPQPFPNSCRRESVGRMKEALQPGVVTIVDTQSVVTREVCVDEDSDGEGIIAHFPAHANQPVAALAFDPSGMLLFTACRLGHNFHIFRIFPHPTSPALGAVHHLYTLHRGGTMATVQNVAFSLDSRWIAVTTLRGTTHIFPITPYGGPVNVRTHTSPRVVNRLSRFQKSAGLEEIQHVPSGRNSPVHSSGSGSGVSQSSRVYDSHPSVPGNSVLTYKTGNPRLPPYPHPTTITPLHQLKPHASFMVPTIVGTNSPRISQGRGRSGSPGAEIVSVTAAFAPSRAWLVGSPSIARDKRDKKAMESLFIVTSNNGSMVEYALTPHIASNLPKVSEESPIELDVSAQAQWFLARPPTSPEISPPLLSTNPLLLAHQEYLNMQNIQNHKQGNLFMQSSKNNIASDQGAKDATEEDLEESWLSQVEMITYAGPHRRLWMGPQFTFKTFQQASNTTVLSPTSSALLSQNPELQTSSIINSDIYKEDLDLQHMSSHRIQSSPVPMPIDARSVGSTGIPLLIEASSGSFEQPPTFPELYGNASSMGKEKFEDQLREKIADAMMESPVKENTVTTTASELLCQSAFEDISALSISRVHGSEAQNIHSTNADSAAVFHCSDTES